MDNYPPGFNAFDAVRAGWVDICAHCNKAISDDPGEFMVELGEDLDKYHFQCSIEHVLSQESFRDLCNWYDNAVDELENLLHYSYKIKKRNRDWILRQIEKSIKRLELLHEMFDQIPNDRLE